MPNHSRRKLIEDSGLLANEKRGNGVPYATPHAAAWLTVEDNLIKERLEMVAVQNVHYMQGTSTVLRLRGTSTTTWGNARSRLGGEWRARHYGRRWPKDC